MRSFLDLEEQRRIHALTRKAVYDRAGIDKGTWTRLTRAPAKCHVSTLEKIEAALAALIEEKAA